MAILVTNQSHFKPLSFDEMIRPYQMLTEEYNKREAEISALDTKAETMRQYAQQEIDAAKLEGRQPASFATQYMDYANSLDKAAEDLATKGLRGTSRKSIYDLTNQYQSDVVPIETALKTRTAKSDEQRKAHLANPNLRFDREFSTIGLQELIDNPDLGYTTYNLKDFEERGALSGAGILGRMTENAVLDPSKQWYNITKGVSQNDLIRWQSGDIDASHYDDAQSINALNAARAEATKIASTVPENLREEVFNRVFENSVNAMKQTTRERTNANFISDAQKTNQEIQLWNAGAMLKDGKLVENPDSPVAKNRAAQANNKYSPSIVGGSLAVTNRETGEVSWYKPDGSVGNAASNKQTEKQLKEALRLGGKDKNGMPLEPILIDKNNSNTAWRTPGYVGQDKVAFKWFDAKRKTRDWGNDYALEKDSPTKEEFDNNFEEISINDLFLYTDLAEAKEKLLSFKTDIDFNNYKIYRSKDKNNRDGIILLPLNHPYVSNEISNTEQPKQGYSEGSLL